MGNPLVGTLLGGLILAAIGALAVIAYRHPAAYAKVFPYLMGVTFTVWVITLVCYLAYGSGFSACTSAIYQLNRGKDVQTPPYPGAPSWVLLSGYAVFLYLGILRGLPLLGITAPEKK